jgi:hypothetical protein
MRQVYGRLESRYRYSNNLSINNFPFPAEPEEKRRASVEQTAQAILNVCTQLTGATFADLYEPNAMPKPLVDAHRAKGLT